MKQPEALRLAENFKQPEMLYTHLLIESEINSGYEPRTHLGCDEKSIVEQAYDEGETSKQIFAWHSDEKFKRLHEANQAMLEALTCMKQAQDNGCSHEEWEVALRKRDAAIAKGEQA